MQGFCLILAFFDTLIISRISLNSLHCKDFSIIQQTLFTLPVYRELKMDVECNYHTLERLLADEEKWAQVQDPASEGHALYQGMIIALADFASELMRLRQQIAIMTEKYFEPLKRRNSGAYAEAYSFFYAQMLSVAAHLFGEDFTQSFPMEVSFVPMMRQANEDEIFIAEKAVFCQVIIPGFAKANSLVLPRKFPGNCQINSLVLPRYFTRMRALRRR